MATIIQFPGLKRIPSLSEKAGTASANADSLFDERAEKTLNKLADLIQAREARWAAKQGLRLV